MIREITDEGFADESYEARAQRVTEHLKGLKRDMRVRNIKTGTEGVAAEDIDHSRQHVKVSYVQSGVRQKVSWNAENVQMI